MLRRVGWRGKGGGARWTERVQLSVRWQLEWFMGLPQHIYSRDRLLSSITATAEWHTEWAIRFTFRSNSQEASSNWAPVTATSEQQQQQQLGGHRKCWLKIISFSTPFPNYTRLRLIIGGDYEPYKSFFITHCFDGLISHISLYYHGANNCNPIEVQPSKHISWFQVRRNLESRRCKQRYHRVSKF